ncbi:gactosylgalactosylxylosylprotein 3-beta-glucuronosyltransferase [Capsaspora owczarzaki ATCC 30864]|uniref:Gactosylgalactosylxylosylprotein 3-beta-glucuronosyltransferase n=1 Tax=Capsaspora owczarzaki (strain ATCC 30864) TaxID=595528 RepID=A0A0D2WV95_CAPO3|nr:gactosylgalactosylxylosylprotein 3-beta-glucuronosyltransferase [Capsaspora owczarzaki ATCC 30864]KJE96053.1 gactosylgalactosylxylosylprotein 3-beta-glucuronosyltransferase [Capsaspora owczarzaki ATCC 30864]|eukprot:XP_004345176.1 gactosylgalactosylxylosylprotein 3-beta-glucuronosyltransferase [Capsaspora owczarzaki ATCC 30864]
MPPRLAPYVLTALASCIITTQVCFVLLSPDPRLRSDCALVHSAAPLGAGTGPAPEAGLPPTRLLPAQRLPMQNRGNAILANGPQQSADTAACACTPNSTLADWNQAAPAYAPLRPEGLPVIYVITPSKPGPTQKADLTRLASTLRQVPALHWIVIEDQPAPTALVAALLERSGMRNSYSHLAVQSEAVSAGPRYKTARGVEQRNLGIAHLRELVSAAAAAAAQLKRSPQRPGDQQGESETSAPEGVVYFADDDNTYDLRVFEEMRFTQHVSVWPVGIVGGLMYEGPVVDLATRRVVRWHVGWKKQRQFPIDMAGFAIHARNFINTPGELLSRSSPRGYLESHLLARFVRQLAQLEPKADLCSTILVWHTRTEAPDLSQEEAHPSDPLVEV